MIRVKLLNAWHTYNTTYLKILCNLILYYDISINLIFNSYSLSYYIACIMDTNLGMAKKQEIVL